MEPIKDFEIEVEKILRKYDTILPEAENLVPIFAITSPTRQFQRYNKRLLILPSGAEIQYVDINASYTLHRTANACFGEFSLKAPPKYANAIDSPTLAVRVNNAGSISIVTMFEDMLMHDPEKANLEVVICKINKKLEKESNEYIRERMMSYNNRRMETILRMKINNRNQQLLPFAKGPGKFVSKKGDFIEALTFYIDQHSSLIELGKI